MVNEFEGVRIRPQSLPSNEEFEGVRIRTKEPVAKEEGVAVQLKNLLNRIRTIDGYKDVIDKSFRREALGILDLPQLAATGVEELTNYIPGVKPTHHMASLTPVSERIRRAANSVGYEGFNEPKIDTAGKKLVSGLAGGAGSAIAGAGIGGLGLKVGMPIFSKFLGSPKDIAGLAKSGAALGGAGAGLEELGADPLTANLLPAVTMPLVGAAGKNLLNKFSTEHRNLKTGKKVQEALTRQIGEENVPQVLNKIKNYEYQKNPIGLELTTPEVAQDVGLSRLYRTESNLPSIPQRHAENDARLLEALKGIGTTGLPESAKGEAIRMPLVKRFNKHKARREKLTSGLYKELESIKEGIDPVNAKALLKEEIAVSGPDNLSRLQRFQKGLTRNEIDPAVLEKIKELKVNLKNIDKYYKHLGTGAMEQLKAPLLKELRHLEPLSLPRPIQIENTIQDLGDKVNTLSRAGNVNAARRYGGIKEAYTKDLANHPIGLKHREEYHRLSRPINEIEASPLLSNFVKENTDVNKAAGFVVPSERLPESIFNSSLADLKLLRKKASGNKELLDLLKGNYTDKLLEVSRLGAGSAPSYIQANQFMNNKYNKERFDVIFNKGEKKKLNQFLDTLKRRNQVENMGKTGGSDTHQKITVGGQFNESLGDLGEVAKKLVADATNTGKVGKESLGWLARRIPRTTAPYKPILEEALLNPKAFRELMTNQDRLKRFKDFYNPLPPLMTGVNLGNRNK